MFPFSPEEFVSAAALLSEFPEIHIVNTSAQASTLDFSVFLIHNSVVLNNHHVRKKIWEKQKKPVLLYGPAEAIRAALMLPCADFITYPFNRDELMSRLFRAAPVNIICSSGHRLSLSRGLLRGTLGLVMLSEHECAVLWLLVSSFPEPVKRKTLFENIFTESSQKSRYPDVIISSLRKKISSVSVEKETPIRTIHGYGYRL